MGRFIEFNSAGIIARIAIIHQLRKRIEKGMTTDPERWRTLSTDDGCPIAVRESGRANGLAFLLVHALAMDASPWDGVARELVAEGNPGISPRSGSPDSSPDRSENRFADR